MLGPSPWCLLLWLSMNRPHILHTKEDKGKNVSKHFSIHLTRKQSSRNILTQIARCILKRPFQSQSICNPIVWKMPLGGPLPIMSYQSQMERWVTFLGWNWGQILRVQIQKSHLNRAVQIHDLRTKKSGTSDGTNKSVRPLKRPQGRIWRPWLGSDSWRAARSQSTRTTAQKMTRWSLHLVG